MLVFAATIICCVGGLFIFHAINACKNVTTNEEIRGKVVNGNPYDKGCKRNCREFCYGGTSRVRSQGYNIESASGVEPNVFIIKPKI